VLEKQGAKYEELVYRFIFFYAKFEVVYRMVFGILIEIDGKKNEGKVGAKSFHGTSINPSILEEYEEPLCNKAT